MINTLVPRKKRFRKRWILLGIILCLGGAIYYFWINLVAGIVPITSTWRYRQILAWMHGPDYPTDSDILRMLPASIPADASNVRMWFFTPPGDLDLELRCTLPQSAVMDLEKHYAPSALAKARGQDQTYQWDQSKIPLPAPHLFVGDPDWKGKLPDTYTMYVTNVAYSKFANSIDAVCMYESGIAMNATTNEVIFWVEGHDGAMPTSQRVK